MINIINKNNSLFLFDNNTMLAYCICSCSDSLSREIIAVDSEDSKNRILDGRRNLQLLKNLLSTKTNYESFSTGNLKTLGMYLGNSQKQ